MAYSFTEGEKRFILGEVIKTSNLDVGHLVEFLKAYQIDPDWLKMQLPSGRTMEQCIQATEHMFQGPMKVPDLKRKSMNDLLEQPPKRLAVAPPMEPPAQLPPLASAQQSPAAYGNSIPMHSILPQLQNTQLASIKPRPITTGVDSRPASNGYPSPSQPQAAPPLPRKRGRPSRADKARQLRPLLPQHLTPLAPAPAPLPPPSARDSPGTPAEGSAYSLSPGPASEAVSEAPRKKRGRPRSVDKAQTTPHAADQPRTPSGRSTPVEATRGRPDDIPRESYDERAQLPESQKERAIPHIGHLTQEGLAR